MHAECSADAAAYPAGNELLVVEAATGKKISVFKLSAPIEAWSMNGEYIAYSLRDWERDVSIFGALSTSNATAPLWRNEFPIVLSGMQDFDIYQKGALTILSPLRPVSPNFKLVIETKSGRLLARHGIDQPNHDFWLSSGASSGYFVTPSRQYGGEKSRLEIIKLSNPSDVVHWFPENTEDFLVEQTPDIVSLSANIFAFQISPRRTPGSISRALLAASYKLVAVDVEQRKLLWSMPVVRDENPRVVALNDDRFALISGRRSVQFFGNAEGKALGATDLAGYDLLNAKWAWGIEGKLVVAVRRLSQSDGLGEHGLVIIDPGSHAVSAFIPTGGKSKYSGSRYAGDEPVPVHVAGCNGRLFVTSDAKVTAFEPN